MDDISCAGRCDLAQAGDRLSTFRPGTHRGVGIRAGADLSQAPYSVLVRDDAGARERKPVGEVRQGTYLALDRLWQTGDRVEVDLDYVLHFWAGERESAGRASVYRGPVLLALDHRYNLGLAEGQELAVREMDEWKPVVSALPYAPRLDASALELKTVEWSDWLPPQLLLRCAAADGRSVYLCDYASAGAAGTPYQTWLSVDRLPAPVPFSRENPLRSVR